MSKNSSKSSSRPSLFATSDVERRVITRNNIMTGIIRSGGFLVILSVFAIFVFIVSQIYPLFLTAQVETNPSQAITTQSADILALGVDEWGQLPFVFRNSGEIEFIPVNSTSSSKTRLFNEPVLAASYEQDSQKVFVLLQSGAYAWINIGYRSVYKDNKQTIEANPTIENSGSLFAGQETPSSVNPGTRALFASNGTETIIALHSGDSLKLLMFESKTNMMGQTTFRKVAEQQLDDLTPIRSAVFSHDARKLIVSDGLHAFYYKRAGAVFQQHQKFTPFPHNSTQIAAMTFLIGDMSSVFVGSDGSNTVFSLSRDGSSEDVLFRHTKTLPNTSGKNPIIVESLRNKNFVIATNTEISIRYSTTESIRWISAIQTPLSLMVLNNKNTLLMTLTSEGQLQSYTIDDPHPDVSLKSFFGKVWYEGYTEPQFIWQSTGGTDDVEPKLSLVPLIFGTLKGTLYAMVFSVPVALLAAIYVSQFLHYKVKRIVKPLMEIMASFPSVILGFLAALWLAPLLENQIPTIFLVLFFVPALSFLCGSLFDYLRRIDAYWLTPGREYIVVMPFILLTVLFCAKLGPTLENILFTFTDPASGTVTADFRLWFRHTFNLSFEQRNSLVVGFMMGFAIIPIIFTVAEDALSNVPENLKSASLALGASRWQTALLVVVPSASSGLFSALIIGLGRAIGETMIVLMATGNTPIMEWNIFNGMRTLSANIAVELPEAPLHSSLYRTLFLGAFLLFMMTFVLNTIADVLRTRLREKYKTI